MMFNVSLGIVDISTPSADVCESIMLHVLVARNLGYLKTLPHKAQGMEISSFHVFQDDASAAGDLATQKTYQRLKLHNVYIHAVRCKVFVL